MAQRKGRLKLDFDQRGGVIALSRAMLESYAYRTLTPEAKVLMMLLQIHWRNDAPVAYGVREAAKHIPCAINTASKTFHMLNERGFIVCETESLFNSKGGSKTREWRLTWMPFEYQKPSHDWEKWDAKNKPTVSNWSTQTYFVCCFLRHKTAANRLVS